MNSLVCRAELQGGHYCGLPWVPVWSEQSLFTSPQQKSHNGEHTSDKDAMLSSPPEGLGQSGFSSETRLANLAV